MVAVRSLIKSCEKFARARSCAMAEKRRSILITGCSSGCGLDAAFTLKARGWRVFAACRKERDCEELRDQGAPSTLHATLT